MKFANEHEQHLWELATDDGGIGDVSGPLGWVGRVTLDPAQFADDEAVANHYEGADLFIVHENSDGVVTIHAYRTQVEHEAAWTLFSQGIALADAQIAPDEARDAIDGYLQAAVFTATDESGETLDGKGYIWSESAQAVARADVIDFITSNVESIREFQRVTGHGWIQVGIDFNFTRNRQGAGFWSRGTGNVFDELTQSAHAHGEVTTFLDEEGELSFLSKPDNVTLSVTLPSGQTIMVWIGTSGSDGSALVQVDTADVEGNLRIFVNDNDTPVFDENPETGRYEAAPGYEEE